MPCGRKRSVWTRVLAAGVLLLASCDRPAPAPDLTDSYNAVAKELLALRESAATLYKNTREENQALGQFNVALEQYLVLRGEKFETAEHVTRAFASIVQKYDHLLNALSELEAITVHTLNSLNGVGDKVLKPGEKDLGRSYVSMIALRYAIRGTQLDGVRRVLETDFQQFCDAHNAKFGTKLALAPRRKITVRYEEFIVAKAFDGHAIARNPDDGHVTILPDAGESRNFATLHSFNGEAAHHFHGLSERTGGFLTFAENPPALGFAISDVLSRIKHLMNQNEEGLDLILLVEGTAEGARVVDTIEESLIHFNLGFGAIKNAGRTVRIGLASYATPGAERLESDLSASTMLLSTALINLSARVQGDKVAPANAIYHGMRHIATHATFATKANRVVILFTRGVPSEVGTPTEAEFIEAAVQSYGKQPKQLRLFTILTR